MAVMGIDHVQVAAPAGCEAQARAFYGGLLGMEELPKPEALAARGGCWFAAGAQELHVGVEEPFAPARKAHPSFVVTDLDGLASKLTEAGIALAHDDLIPGVKRFEAADPFGNRLEFRQAPEPGSPS
jgi:catechol 2,3-dioxygenase-like lactoylglutathione lyase family enzyme